MNTEKIFKIAIITVCCLLVVCVIYLMFFAEDADKKKLAEAQHKKILEITEQLEQISEGNDKAEDWEKIGERFDDLEKRVGDMQDELTDHRNIYIPMAQNIVHSNYVKAEPVSNNIPLPVKKTAPSKKAAPKKVAAKKTPEEKA